MAKDMKKDSCRALVSSVIICLAMIWSAVFWRDSVHAAELENVIKVPIKVTENYSMANELLAEMNSEREILGLQPLVMDQQLMESALVRAAEATVLNSHWRPNGTRSTSMMNVEAVYENINSYAVSASSICSGWMGSSSHRQAIMDPACKSVGIGIVNHVAVAEFSYTVAEPVSRIGTAKRERTIEFRSDLCQFVLENTLEYGSKEKLMLVSTIENQGIPTEVDLTQFTLTSNLPEIATVLPNGEVHGKQAGTTQIEIRNKSQSSFQKELTVVVKTLDISIHGNVECSYQKNHTYSGQPIMPEVTVKDKYGTVLQTGRDVVIEYQDNREVGTAYIKVTGKGNYSGTRYLPFTIQQNTVVEGANNNLAQPETEEKKQETEFLANFTYILPNVELERKSYIYDGTAKTPAVVVSVKGEKLQQGQDYQVRYANNVQPGEAIVIIQGINRCSGEYRITFYIEKISQKKETEAVTEEKKEVAGTITTIVNNAEISNKQQSGLSTITNNISRETEKQKTTEAVVKKNTKKITVKQLKIQKIKRSRKKQITVYWKKDKTVSGYQVQIATNKKMTKGRKLVKVSKKKTSCTIKKLKSKRTYYVRARAYKKVKGTVVYGKWSMTKRIKVK